MQYTRPVSYANAPYADWTFKNYFLLLNVLAAENLSVKARYVYIVVDRYISLQNVLMYFLRARFDGFSVSESMATAKLALPMGKHQHNSATRVPRIPNTQLSAENYLVQRQKKCDACRKAPNHHENRHLFQGEPNLLHFATGNSLHSPTDAAN